MILLHLKWLLKGSMADGCASAGGESTFCRSVRDGYALYTGRLLPPARKVGNACDGGFVGAVGRGLLASVQRVTSE